MLIFCAEVYIMDIVSLWDKTLQLIKGELSPPSFNAFFKQIIPLKIHIATNCSIFFILISLLSCDYLNII